MNLQNNPKLWALYIDLEINFGTFETAKGAYRKMAEIKVITPVILLNFAQYLEDHGYFEDSFKIFETGLSLFVWPGVYDIWVTYISKFIARYQGMKLERTRDLFEKVLVLAPQEVDLFYY